MACRCPRTTRRFFVSTPAGPRTRHRRAAGRKRPWWSEGEPDGTDKYAILVAQDQRGAVRGIFQYAVAPFGRIAALKRILTGQHADSYTLKNGIVLAAYPCRPAAVRGLRACVVVVDELAFFTSSEGKPTDTEMLRAVPPVWPRPAVVW
jgi:hypothetical protein